MSVPRGTKAAGRPLALCCLIVSMSALACDEMQSGGSGPSPCADLPDSVSPNDASNAPALTESISVVSEGVKREVSLKELSKKSPLRTVATEDPYYKKEKRFLAFSWASLLPVLFGPSAASDPDRVVQLTAKDGYQVRMAMKLLQGPAPHLAACEAGTHRFQPIGPQEADPGPLYMIWEGDEYGDEKLYPRPWAIARIELLQASASFRHLRPEGGFGGDVPAERGHDLFQKACIRCHSINQEGGKVGPDLNVPQNILDYRPPAQVRAYIKNPATFRYSTMPAHPQFTDRDLDDLLAYLQVMGDHMHDPVKAGSEAQP